MLCSVGTFYNTTSRQCQFCPVGQYQDREGQFSCKSCPSSPQATTTYQPGAQSIFSCKGVCVWKLEKSRMAVVNLYQLNKLILKWYKLHVDSL